MKKTLVLAGLLGLFAAPAFAQSEKVTTKNSATGAKTTTEVDVRENGTVKVETDARTGRTKAGETINDAAQDTKHAAKKVANGTEKVAEKTASGAKTAGKKAVNATEKAGRKIDEKAEKGIDKAKDAVD